jgi:hypothetical protein
MRKLLLLPLLALLAAPLPAAAQSNSQLFCFANDTLAVQTRVRILQIRSDGFESNVEWMRVGGKSRYCVRLVRPFGVRFQVQSWNARWEAAANCGRTIWQPSGGTVLRMSGHVLNFICSEE